MAKATREAGASIPAWIGRLGLAATYLAAALLALVEQAAQTGVQVEIRQYAA